MSEQPPQKLLDAPNAGQRSRPSPIDLFVSEHTGNGPPTPPYRRDASVSQEVLGTAHPPDYRSEMNVSRENVRQSSEDVHQFYKAQDEKLSYPKEKESTQDSTSKGVHYPDLDGPSSRPSQPRPVPSRQSSFASSDIDDDEEEIYNWSDEEDLVDQEAKFEQKMGRDNRKKKGWSFGRFLTFFFSTLIGSLLLSGALVAGAVILRIYWLKPHRTDHRTYITDNVSAWLFWAAANVTISWWLASFIDVLPHIIASFVGVVWGTVTESMKSKIELYETGKGWIKPPFYAACAWAAWAILFDGIFDLYDPHNPSASRASYTPRVYQVIRFLFFLTLVVSVEKMLLQMIAFSFHQTAFKERLDSVANAIAVLDHLKDFRPKRRQQPSGGRSGVRTPIFSSLGFTTPGGSASPEGADYMTHRPQRSGAFTAEPAALEEGLADIDTDHEGDGKKKKRSSKGWFNSSGKSSGKKPVRNGSGESSRDGATPDGSLQMESMHKKGEHTYPPVSWHQHGAHTPLRQGSPTASGSGTPTRRSEDGHNDKKRTDAVIFTAAKALKTVVLHDARNMRSATMDADLDTGLKFSNAHEAKKLARDLYYAFKSDRKRTYLIPSDFYVAYNKPEDAKEAFKVFDKDDNGDITRAEIKTAVMKFYKERRFLARSLRDVSAAVTTLDHIMLCGAMLILFFVSLSIFGVSIGGSISSIYTIFIAASFIFKNAASSAFDAIMFLFVTHPFDTGDRVFVDNENFIVKKMGLFATTFTRADGTETYYFNSMLFTKFINNIRRSGNCFEGLEMQVNWKTPQKKLDALEKCINHWIDNDEKRWFVPGTNVVLQRIEFQRNLELTMGIGHNGTWQDWGLRLARKTAFHAAVQFYCRQLDITWSDSPQPILFTDTNLDQPHMDDEIEYEIADDATAQPTTPISPHPSRAPTTKGATAPQKAMLGFLPPKDGHSTLRVRKSRAKKHMGAGMD